VTSILDQVELHLVQTPDELDEFRRWLGERRRVLAVDIETTGLSLGRDRIRLVQFGDTRQGWALPYEDWRGMVRWVLREYEGPTVGHNIKFDSGMLMRDGLDFNWTRTHDTQVMCFLVNSMGPKGLKPASALYVDQSARAGEGALKKFMAKHRLNFETVPVDSPIYWGYGAADTVLTAMLAEKLWPHVQPYRDAYDLEMACGRVLLEMELRGVRIDIDYCAKTRDDLAAQLEVVMERLRSYEVNPNAPQQIIDHLQSQGAVLTKQTEKGQLSVDDEVLSALAQHGFAVAGDVLEARGLLKIIRSYFDNFARNRVGDILNPHIHQLAARTGRMSITEPALQTLPKTSLVRDAFIPREGNTLVLADYDNQELRMAAHFSGDEAMLVAFHERRDLHAETARRLYGDDFTSAQRSKAKNSMFAMAYGAGEDRFAGTAGMQVAEATAIFKMIKQLYPGLTTTMAQVTNMVRARAQGGAQFGWVQLIDGRHLKVRADKPYIGFNALIQGSCAVVLKQALVDLDNAGLGDFLVLPVHDEVVFDVPLNQVDEVVPEITRVMTRDDFRAVLTVGTKIVPTWGTPYRKVA